MSKEDPRLTEYKKTREFALRCKYGQYIAQLILLKEAEEAEGEAEEHIQEREELKKRLAQLESGQQILVNEVVMKYNPDEVPSLAKCEDDIEYLLSREPTTEGDIKQVLSEELWRLQTIYYEFKEYAKRVVNLEAELLKFKALLKLANETED